MFYAFQFRSGRNTTTGEPNPRTGRMSKAGSLEVFATRAERDAWVAEGKTTSDMQGNCREAVTRAEARKLCRGCTMAEFNNLIALPTYP